MKDTWISPSANTEQDNVSIGLESMKISEKMVEACPTCQCHHPQEPRQPLQPTPAPECPWQCLGADFFTFDGFEYLVIINYYTKMPFIRKIPPPQFNAANTTSSPRNPRSNGQAEAAVKVTKGLLTHIQGRTLPHLISIQKHTH